MRTNRNRIEFDDRIIRRYPLQAHDQRDIDLIAARHEAARRADCQCLPYWRCTAKARIHIW